jgi:hypothetical protein
LPACNAKLVDEAVGIDVIEPVSLRHIGRLASKDRG